ncbi:hypothetical protein Syun_023007 [Stephania yunnanensis]|uniref:Uncharacterized protein n=1 Tax=Stephania yunnanensis TaxID=152371 RepID=A0AAP0I346_9MAGN
MLSAKVGASTIAVSGRRICRRWCQLSSLPVQPPPLVAAIRCRVGNQGRLPWPFAVGGYAAPAAVHRSSSLPWNAIGLLLPRPSAVAGYVALAAVHHSSSCLQPLAVQPPPSFKDIFQKHLDWEVLPLMLEKQREPLLRDTLQRWSNHKKWLKTAWKKRRNGSISTCIQAAKKSYWGTERVAVGICNPTLRNEHPRLHALLRDEKEEDLIKMYWIFYRIPQGLDTIANIFKKVFWKTVIGLHDKHLGYVTKYFKNNILFREIFLGKAFQVAGKGVCIIFIAKMLAAYCHDILKRGREELVIETVEKTLKKASISKMWYAHRLLYIMKSEKMIQKKSMIAELSSHYGILFRAMMENMKAVLTLAKNMQINFEEYLTLNPQKQSKQYLRQKRTTRTLSKESYGIWRLSRLFYWLIVRLIVRLSAFVSSSSQRVALSMIIQLQHAL